MHQQPASESEIVPRDIRFSVDQCGGRHWLNDDPVATAVMNALSLTFPDGEKLFMDSVRHFRHFASGPLIEDVRSFLAQEAAHSREHHALNAIIDSDRYPVEEILTHVRERISHTRSKGPYAMLLSTIALEHFTAIMADMHLKNPGLFESSDPEVAKLWRWHALEETEHKAVAFDVFLAATAHWPARRRYLARSISMALVTWHFTRNIASHASRLLQTDGYSPTAARRAVRGYLWGKPGLFRRVWRDYIAWYRPGFHPWQLDNRNMLKNWRQEFSTYARSTTLALLVLGLTGTAPTLMASNWVGKGELGLVVARGNSEASTVNAKLELAEESENWKNGFNLAALSATNDGTQNAERYAFSWQTDYKFSEVVFAFGNLRYEDDRFSGFDYQASASAGIGRHFIDDDTTKLTAQLGSGYKRRKDDLTNETTGSLVWTGEIKFQRALTETTSLIEKLVVESDSDNTFAKNELSIQVKMNSKLSLAAGLGVRFNSDPPAGRKKTDTLTTINLVYGF